MIQHELFLSSRYHFDWPMKNNRRFNISIKPRQTNRFVSLTRNQCLKWNLLLSISHWCHHSFWKIWIVSYRKIRMRIEDSLSSMAVNYSTVLLEDKRWEVSNGIPANIFHIIGIGCEEMWNYRNMPSNRRIRCTKKRRMSIFIGWTRFLTLNRLRFQFKYDIEFQKNNEV